MGKLEGKVAVITGASKGIGEGIAKVYAKYGAKCVLAARGPKVLELAEELKKQGYEAVGVQTDVSDFESVKNLVKVAEETYGPVDILVNNAGVGYYGLHEELNPAKIKELVRTNLETPMILTQQLLRQFKKNAGIIINISSVTADESNPHGCAYGATKAGLASFSHSLFDETRKYGVKVVTISPDMTKTNLYRNADFQEGEESASYLLPEEIADAVEFVLGQREGLVVSDLKLKPQLHRIRRKQKVTNAKNKDEA